jgi:putative component of membrane protein insertase Oxa1/YidC/SpoIIIJ protein YidD
MAIDEYGPAKGICLGIKRFCRCHPWSEGGFDPVPKKIQASAKNVRGIALNNQNKL